jgi:phosphomannomutase/phosphoglucomutase
VIGKKKKDPATETAAVVPIENTGKPHSMLHYVIPVLVVGVVVIAGLAFGQAWLNGKSANKNLDQSARMLATTINRYSAAVVQGKMNMVRFAAADPALAGAISRGDQAMLNAAGTVQKNMSDAISVKLIPAKSWDDAKVQSFLFGSYAAAEMFQQVRNKSKSIPVAALKDNTGKFYFLIAMPVRGGSNLAGVLFAQFPVKIIADGLKDIRLKGVGFRLEQDTGMPIVEIGEAISKSPDNATPVPGTLWHVVYVSNSAIGTDVVIQAALAGVAIALLLFVIFWSYGRLRKDYQQDMGMMVMLVDATLKRLGSVTQQPKLLESMPAMEMLTRYAQATHVASTQAEHRENRAGQPQMTAGDLEDSKVQEQNVQSISAEHLPESLFRASVIRGRSGMDLNSDIAQAVGLVVGSMAQEAGGDSVLVGRDNRPASDDYAASIVAGILASGCDVVDLEMVPMPLVSFATHVSPSRTAIMVTGGHCSPDMNGFKIIVDGEPMSRQQLLELRQRILSGGCSKGLGQLTSRDMSSEYIRTISDDVQLVDGMKVVLDCGNGVTGSVATRMLEGLGCEVIPLFCESDGSYPNHMADVSDVDNMAALAMEVQAREADIGIALDADGDALAVVDEKGRTIAADELIMKLGSDIIHRHPGADVIYDVACSANLPAIILSNGGRPIMWKTGHARLQQKLRETGGMLAGEMSGHIYIQERWYGFDDGMYAAARLLEILSLETTPVSETFNEYQSEFVTPLMQIETPEGRARQIVAAVQQVGEFEGADIVDLDGVRVEYAESWGLIRSSNTQSALIFRFEASNAEALDDIQGKFRMLLSDVAPELALPF